MTPHLALLRGINVGGKNKLSMKDLARIFEAVGCADVRTYIQSGNVLFTAPPDLATSLPAAISAAIEQSAGLQIPVIIRTAAELSDAIRHNPYLKQGADEAELHLMFLADTPAPDRIAALDPDRSPPDTFAVRGREIYLRLPNGMGRTKLTNAYFDSKLATIGTARNWRTVTTLAEMLKSG